MIRSGGVGWASINQFGITVIGEAVGESSDDRHFCFDFPQ